MPNGSLEGIEHAGDDYERAIAEAGGVDLQLLGIGTDGHIGFNEPGSSFASLTRVKTLTEQTREDNARFFDSIDDVPLHCITQGLGTILRARHLVLLAFGEGKAEAVAGAVEGPVDRVAAGLGDPAASARDGRRRRGRGIASRDTRDYYRYTFATSPTGRGCRRRTGVRARRPCRGSGCRAGRRRA